MKRNMGVLVLAFFLLSGISSSYAKQLEVSAEVGGYLEDFGDDDSDYATGFNTDAGFGDDLGVKVNFEKNHVKKVDYSNTPKEGTPEFEEAVEEFMDNTGASEAQARMYVGMDPVYFSEDEMDELDKQMKEAKEDMEAQDKRRAAEKQKKLFGDQPRPGHNPGVIGGKPSGEKFVIEEDVHSVRNEVQGQIPLT